MKTNQLTAHILYYYGRMTQADIAALLNVNVRTIYRWLKRIDKTGSTPLTITPCQQRKKIRQQLTGLSPAPTLRDEPACPVR